MVQGNSSESTSRQRAGAGDTRPGLLSCHHFLLGTRSAGLTATVRSALVPGLPQALAMGLPCLEPGVAPRVDPPHPGWLAFTPSHRAAIQAAGLAVPSPTSAPDLLLSWVLCWQRNLVKTPSEGPGVLIPSLPKALGSLPKLVHPLSPGL